MNTILTVIFTIVGVIIFTKIIIPLYIATKNFIYANRMIIVLEKPFRREKNPVVLETILRTKVFNMTSLLEENIPGVNIYTISVITNDISYNFIMRHVLLTDKISCHYDRSFMVPKGSERYITKGMNNYIFAMLIHNDQIGKFLKRLIKSDNNHEIGTDENIVTFYDSIGWNIN